MHQIHSSRFLLSLRLLKRDLDHLFKVLALPSMQGLIAHLMLVTCQLPRIFNPLSNFLQCLHLVQTQVDSILPRSDQPPSQTTPKKALSINVSNYHGLLLVMLMNVFIIRLVLNIHVDHINTLLKPLLIKLVSSNMHAVAIMHLLPLS